MEFQERNEEEYLRWGVKWNAYEFCDNGVGLRVDTPRFEVDCGGHC